jgi:ATP-binding cassette, subfamily B, bacterial
MAALSTLSSALIKLHKLIMTDKRDVTSVYFFAIVGGLISLTLPLGIQTIINFVMAATLSTSIVILIIIVIFGVFLNGFVQVRQSQVIERIRQKLFTRYALEFSSKIPQINLQEMDNYYLPEVINRFFDIPALAKSIEKLLIEIPTSVIQILLGLILLSFYHPVFIAFGAFVLIVLIVIISITSPKGFETNMVSSDYKYKTAGWLQEVARGSKTFRYSKGSALHMQKSDELISEFLESRTAHFKILTTQYWSLIVFKILIVATMLVAGTWLLLNQQINVGQFIAADIVIILIITSVEKLIATMDNVYDSLTSIEKLSKIVDCKIEASGNLNFKNSTGCFVQFNEVGFVYPNGSMGLKHADFMLASNQVLCVKGESGAGRSTILRLLTGAYTGFTGSILLNQIPIGNYNLKDLRANTGIMLNEQDIFRGTILENLTMGNTAIYMEEITSLADKIGFTDFIINNKNGYDTVLDPTGKRLSQHVRQNIKLMRALLGKPTLLLLETPLEHLNYQQQFTMMKYLRLESNATVIIISNDKDLQELSDQVLVLENGVIIN